MPYMNSLLELGLMDNPIILDENGLMERPITFLQLLTRCNRIKIPLLQRDFAQGRCTEREVRDQFLSALKDALLLDPNDPELPLNLDFVYGSIEAGANGSFLPLDGQQRLTTLFLLHWYLAYLDGKLPEFQTSLWDENHSRFNYSVRPSCTEFFDELVRYDPLKEPKLLVDQPWFFLHWRRLDPTIQSVRLSDLIVDQPWFFLHWQLDPTIQSVLVMLDSIDQFFWNTDGLFARLTSTENLAITFQYLRLEHFGLSDDLYIKMNARGKPLTSFETFKARFEERLIDLYSNETRTLHNQEVAVNIFFENRIDTTWTDFFWRYKDTKTHTFDVQIMNFLLTVARISLDAESERFNEETTLLRDKKLNGTFSLFSEHGWLTRNFADNFINLLETWSREPGKFTPILEKTRYFDEATLFNLAINDPTALNYTQLVQLAAFVYYLQKHKDDVQPENLNEWMRVVYNLATNTIIERPEDYGKCLTDLLSLLPHSHEILEHLSAFHLSIEKIGMIGFSSPQMDEEILKAKLFLSSDSGVRWRKIIDEAEAHGYFSGQIEFLLDFCGVHDEITNVPIEEWNETMHSNLQEAFSQYFAKAKITFTSTGLNVEYTESYLWKRALLTIGDYLLSVGGVGNYTFLTDAPAPRNTDSWKRFLRSSPSPANVGKRNYLKTLWKNHIDVNKDIEQQLLAVISSGLKLELEPWSAAIINYPVVLEYCMKQQIRSQENIDEIFLLRGLAMNGAHAELFSYILDFELRNNEFALAPLSLQPYKEEITLQIQPRVHLQFTGLNQGLDFFIVSTQKQFSIYTNFEQANQHGDISAMLINQEFIEGGGRLSKLVPREEIHDKLQELAKTLNSVELLPPNI
jgi:hypothetical protein